MTDFKQYIHENVKNFRIGDIIESKNTYNYGYGWITGLTLNEKKEVLFKVRWASSPIEETRIHPSYIKSIYNTGE